MKKIIAFMLVLALAFAVIGCAKTEKAAEEVAEKAEETVQEVAETVEEKAEEVEEAVEEAVAGPISYAEYVATADGTNVAFEAYVQAIAYNSQYGNASLFLADEDGAYYVYRMPCTDEDAAVLVPGTKILVKGEKTSWSGENEIAEGSATYEVLEGSYIAPATDVTSFMDAEDELIQHMNKLIAIKGAEVVASPIEGDDTEYAVWYGWENTAQPGENSDLYFNISVDGNVYNVCVESDECNMDTDVYKAAEALKIGDKIDLEGFLYWYNGANPHITMISAAA